jgi:hypothetical protein
MGQTLCAAEHPQPEKLSELRAKTDRQLLDFVHSKLEIGLNLAAAAEAEYLDSNHAAARKLESAKSILTELQNLLPLVREEQRDGLCSKFNELLEALERLSRQRESPRTQTASVS